MNTSSITYQFTHFMHRYHFTVFVVVAVGSIAGAVFAIFMTIQSTNTTADSQPAHGMFTDVPLLITISKVNKLKDVDSNTTFSLPDTARNNPFAE